MRTAFLSRRVVRIALILVIDLCLVLVFAEGSVALLLHSPGLAGLLPKGAQARLRSYYLDRFRHVVQMTPKFSRWDPELMYTLQPGRFVFANPEYSNEFRINALGTRDEADALVAPEVVVLGDSFAMGWGVEQEQAFPQVLAKLTNYKVLNAAVASYGTARERMLLDRIDTSRMEFLVVQYCHNDLAENSSFERGQHQLQSAGQDGYRRAIRAHLQSIRYYPGKHLMHFFLPRLAALFQRGADELDAGDAEALEIETSLFLSALVHAGHTDLSGVSVIFVQLDSQGDGTDLLARLPAEIESGSYPDYVKNLIIVDAAAVLSASDYYVLDDHLRAGAQEKIAKLIAQVLAPRPADTGPASGR